MNVKVGWEHLEERLAQYYKTFDASVVSEPDARCRIYRGWLNNDFFGPLFRVSSAAMREWCNSTLEVLDAEIDVWLRAVRRRMKAWMVNG